MSSSPIEYRSFTKILLCCNIPALSASSLQKKRRNKVMCETQNINDINKHRDKNYLHSVSVQLYGIYNSRLYVGIQVIHHFSLQLKTIILKMNNSGTCLIRHTKGPEKCVGLYRVLENSGFLFS